MKRSIINAAFALLVGVVLTFVGCEEPTPEPVTPQFPEKVSAVVSAGDRYEFTISPNMAWSMKIPDEVATYFKFIVGETERYNLYGEAGTHTITVGVSNIEEFDTVRVCQITMTMGDQSAVVADITRSGLERMAKMYLAEFISEEEGFASDEDGNWTYSTTAAERLDWVWYNDQWMQRVAIDANFDWSLSPNTPEWLDINTTSGDAVTEGKAGRTELFILINREALPLEDVTCNIEFGMFSSDNAFEAISTYETSMEGCQNVCEVELASTLTFNADGEYYQSGSESYIEIASGYIASPRGARLVLLNKVADGTYTTEGIEWLTLTIDEFPKEAGEYGVWTRDFYLTAAENTTTKERKGALVALPKPIAESLTNDYVLEDYIVCTITQEAMEEEVDRGAIYPNDESIMAAFNSKFENLASGSWPYQDSWSSVPNAYKLTYQSNASGDDLIFNIPFSRYEIYGYDAFYADAYDLSTCWITIEPSEERKGLKNGYIIKSRLNETIDNYQYINTKAGWDGENEASILFFDENDKPYAFIYFILDPTYTTPIDRPDGTVIFSNNQDYEALGVTLREIVDGDEEYSAELAYSGTLQYMLTLNANCTSATLFVPDFWMSYPYANWVRTSDGTGRVTITVNPSDLPEVEAGVTDVRTKISLFAGNGSSQVVQFIVVYQL